MHNLSKNKFKNPVEFLIFDLFREFFSLIIVRILISHIFVVQCAMLV